MVKDGAWIWLNGRLAPVAEAQVSVRDRGFTLGDGVFETIRAVNERPVGLIRHLARLRHGVSLLGFAVAWSDLDLRTAIEATLRANGRSEAVIRLTVSRGVPSRRGLLPDPAAVPTIVIDAVPFADYPADLVERGLRLVTARTRRNEHSPVSTIKSLNYLDNVLARRDAAAAGADDAVVLNTAGRVAGASAANLWILTDAGLITPPPAEGALPGTVRDLILTHLASAAGLPVQQRPIHPSDFVQAPEAFVTNALMGVMPAVTLDGRPIGSGQPGSWTRRLRAGFLDWQASDPD